MLQAERLILRKWTQTDADSLYEYAKDPAVGPIAGWPPHQSKEESLDVIRNVLNGAECYAIREKGSDKPIDAVELMLRDRTGRWMRVGLLAGQTLFGAGLYAGGGKRAALPRL